MDLQSGTRNANPLSDITNTSNTLVSFSPPQSNNEKNITALLLTNVNGNTVIDDLKSIAPHISEASISLIQAEIKNSNVKDIHGRRWDPEIIELCLSIWNRSPKAYEELCASEALVLSSTKTLSGYKNSVQQKPGINEDVLHWMYLDAKNRKLPPQGYHGGLIFDEMSIQDDLQIHQKKLVGLQNMGSEGTV